MPGMGGLASHCCCWLLVFRVDADDASSELTRRLLRRRPHGPLWC